MLTNQNRLVGVNDKLQDIVRLAVEDLDFDVIVIEGLRPQSRQNKLYAQGRTEPGNIVTWTLESEHTKGNAVDLAPIKDGIILWADSAKFKKLADAMFRIAGIMGVAIRWGKDWDNDKIIGEKDETDSPHFELTGVHKWESKSSLDQSSQQLQPSLEQKHTESPKVETKPIQQETKPIQLGFWSQLIKRLTRK